MRCVVMNLPDIAKYNTKYRNKVYSNNEIEIVTMKIVKNQNIGMEAHPNTTQITTIVNGKILVTLRDATTVLVPGDTIIIPSDTLHDIKAIEDTILYTIYSPPEKND